MSILVKNISKKFGDFIAVDDVSFEVNAGELATLLGPSGCGKSTILRIIAGLEIPDSGEIYLTGTDITSLSVQKRKVGFVFQHYALFKHMSAEKNIAFGMQVQKQKKEYIRHRVDELIDLVQLRGYEKHYPDQLSGGQRQRVALARALATEPKVLLLDEPFGACDAKVRDNLAVWLREFHKKLNTTSIFVTHDQDEAIEISDKIIVINHGKVEQTGTAKEVYEHPCNKFVASFIGQVNVLDAIVKKKRILISGTEYVIENQNNAPKTNEYITLLVRPEDIELHSAKDNKYDIPGQIKRIQYQGSYYIIDCAINDINIRVIENKTRLLKEQWHENQHVFLCLKSYQIFNSE